MHELGEDARKPPATLIADLDLGRVREESMTLDVAGHYSRPDCLELRLTRGRR
jgi:hypothetical protein